MKAATILRIALATAFLALPPFTLAHEGQKGHKGGILTPAARHVKADFDLFHTKVGTLGGGAVFSCVWPTSIDPYVVGIEQKSGILAFADTSHPDFDDTPLYDENGDGDRANDGNLWHSHWVVLTRDDACGKDALKVVDIPPGTKPRLPKTWPGLPILIDSPAWSPVFKGQSLEVRVPFDDIGAVEGASFDGVTAVLRVNASVHNPLLCVADVFKIASGKLTLPGKVNQ